MYSVPSDNVSEYVYRLRPVCVVVCACVRVILDAFWLRLISTKKNILLDRLAPNRVPTHNSSIRKRACSRGVRIRNGSENPCQRKA